MQRDPLPRLGLLVLAPLAAATAARAQVATALLRELDPLPAAGAGHAVTAISNTAGNRAGGFSATINTSDGVTTLSHVWGNASGGAGALMRSEQLALNGYDQTAFETFYGMSDAGEIAYGPTCNEIGGASGLDCVWLDDQPLGVEGHAIPSLPGMVYRFNSRPGVTGNGVPYWVAGINTSGGTQMGNGLFSGVAQTCVIKTGDPMPAPLASTIASAGVGFDVRYSADATHWIADITSTDASTANTHVLLDGALAQTNAGTFLSEGSAVPAASGGLAGESWANWGFLGITESGHFMVTGDTSAATTMDGFVLRDGAIVWREGQVLDGLTLVGSPSNGAYMSETGEIAMIWDTTGSVEALFLEGELLLKEGDQVDWDGDGAVDANATLVDFTGITCLTTSTSSVGGSTRHLLFTADVNVSGNVLEGFFRLPLPAPGEPFCAGDGVDPSVTTGCPCANFGAVGHGCANSTNASGALLSATGSTSADDVVLAASGMPSSVSCIYLQGDALDDATFGDGVRCAGGNLIRLRTRQNVGGASTFPDSTDTITLSQRGGVTIGSGAQRFYQTYYRNAAALFCPPETFNVTNGWRIVW